jgi:hypothetical protein
MALSQSVLSEMLDASQGRPHLDRSCDVRDASSINAQAAMNSTGGEWSSTKRTDEFAVSAHRQVPANPPVEPGRSLGHHSPSSSTSQPFLLRGSEIVSVCPLSGCPVDHRSSITVPLFASGIVFNADEQLNRFRRGRGGVVRSTAG